MAHDYAIIAAKLDQAREDLTTFDGGLQDYRSLNAQERSAFREASTRLQEAAVWLRDTVERLTGERRIVINDREIDPLPYILDGSSRQNAPEAIASRLDASGIFRNMVWRAAAEARRRVAPPEAEFVAAAKRATSPRDRRLSILRYMLEESAGAPVRISFSAIAKALELEASKLGPDLAILRDGGYVTLQKFADGTPWPASAILTTMGFQAGEEGWPADNGGGSRHNISIGDNANIGAIGQAGRDVHQHANIGDPKVPPSESRGSAYRESSATSPSKVFLVHGTNLRRHEVARFLESGGLDVVLLEERASQGRTIIEQIEYYGDVSYAIVLMTADDVGRRASHEDLKPRARQNVILELGYFMGRLGRGRVLALHEEGVELPSDYGGVVYEPLIGMNWKLRVARELEDAELTVDTSRMLGLKGRDHST